MLILSMFVRKKKNPSGKISVQVIDKSSGKYRVIHTAGSSSDKEEIASLVKTAKSWIKNRQSTLELDFSDEREQIQVMLNSITELKRVRYDLVLGRIFDEIGFNQIKDDLFRDLVIARIAYPKSKLKTKDYLYRFKQVHYDEDQIYRYLDKLHDKQKELAQQISYEHTRQILNQDISVVFYDVTTLYFEIDQEDELRKTGFSKEGKHQNPQIVLGLLVSKNGYPLAYEIFEGNKFEGHTMLPVVDAFKVKYKLDKLIIIADSGLLSRSNIDNLQDIQNYRHLWQIEYAFRIAKTDLKIRPIYHRLQRRIEAHICISFVAYKVFKELERQLKVKNANISANKAIEIAENIHEITFELPSGNNKISKLLLLTEEQKYFASLFEI